MIPEYHLLRLAERLDLQRHANDRLHFVHAQSRGAQLDVPAGWWSLWLPLHDDLQLQSSLSVWPLPRGHWLVAREALQGTARTSSGWLALAGSGPAWNLALQAAAAQLLPQQGPCPRSLRRFLVHLARQLRAGCETVACEATLQALGRELCAQQVDLQPLLDRCNGRSPQRRYLTLQRLLRVHQLIERDGDGQLGLTQLARIASYSPWHLIRMYRDVFGETPSEHIARRRLIRAWAMVRDSALPVCEITEKLGFESQSAFCRAFKNAYGLTTTQARHLPTSARTGTPRHGRARARQAQSRTA